MEKIWEIFKEWAYQSSVSVDQFVNAFVFFGSSDETLSCRCFRLDHILTYRILETFINGLFFLFQGPHHCRHAYMKEVLGRQLPYKFYDLAIEMNLRYDKDKLGDKVEIPL